MLDKYGCWQYCVKNITTCQVKFFKNRSYAQSFARCSNYPCVVFGYGKSPLNLKLYIREYL